MSVVVTVKFAHMYRSGAKLRACRAAGRQSEINSEINSLVYSICAPDTYICMCTPGYTCFD